MKISKNVYRVIYGYVNKSGKAYISAINVKGYCEYDAQINLLIILEKRKSVSVKIFDTRLIDNRN